ncbi:Phosphatidylglycerophosphate synthase [Nitrosomonas sp. Nm51]|uniref:CDP-alcohol phosphatidyltransferase family protein n=1 Tax=Nitrosomonas sp. Nm51 TaxID=133720 RepID=UPI0008AF9A39|nr:CDP-alcohol phosphatidyltransferase family protein [Nitrosomonas sp. Nm51]SER00727.1 Phosphatidylglycerophosphate synthase [Nitrosomonas sp. Nm51]
MQKTTYILIIGGNRTTIWGLDGHERLERMIQSIKNVKLTEKTDDIPDNAPLLILNAHYLFDSRVLTALIALKDPMVLYSHDNQPAAVRTFGGQASHLLGVLVKPKNQRPEHILSGLPRYTLSELNIDFQQNLKKKDPPYILPITEDNRKRLEKELFSGSYKGVTDLVTKWLWPLPAFWCTHLCVRKGWKPNHVTLLSAVLALLAGIAFWYGFFAIGLIMGWMMTFLDTVDGKLARVTVTSSKFGDVLDHGLDIIHPPLWYLAWGIGLAGTLTPIGNLDLLIWLMFFGYIGGRLCEGAFQLWLAPFDMFIWRKADSFNRLITARRNPNLILLTYGWIIERPDVGLLLVVAWHLLSTAILLGRLIAGWRIWRQQGKLRSWLQDIDPARDRNILAVKIFTRAPIDPKRLQPAKF